MKKIALFALIIVICLLLVVPGLNVSALEVKGVPDFNKGDYAKYDYDISGLIDQLSEEDEDIGLAIDDSTIDASAKVEVTGEETLEVDGEDIDCFIIERTMLMSFTFSGEYLNAKVSMSMSMDTVVTSWESKSDYVTLKEEDETTTSSNMDFPDDFEFMGVTIEDMVSEEVDTSTKTATSYTGGWPEIIKVGDTWEIDVEYEETTVSKSRDQEDGEWGDWEEDEYEGTGTIYESYEAISEEEVKVPAGKFDCIKIEVFEEDYSDWEDDYYDDDDWYYDEPDDRPTTRQTSVEEEPREEEPTGEEEEEEEEPYYDDDEPYYDDDEPFFGDGEETEYRYLDEDGIPVKIEFVDEDDESTMSMQLKKYKIGDRSGGASDDDDFFLPGFGASVAIVGGIAALFITRKRK